MVVKVHLEGDGLTFEDETNVFNAAQIIGFLKNSESLTGGAPSGGVASQPPLLGNTQTRTSPREALQTSGAKTNPQKIAVLGHYQAAANNHEGFTIDEVKAAFKRAGEPLPKNLGRDVQAAVTSSLIYEEDGETGYYILSESAVEAIESGFQQQGKKAVKAKREGGKRSNGTARVSLNEELLKSLKQKNGSLQEFIQARQAAYDVGASNQVAIIATWLMDEMRQEGISPSDLQAVRRYLGEPGGNPWSQLNNAKNRAGYFSHANGGNFYLSGLGEDFGRIKSKA
jgi:hypothetical protein